MAQSRDATWIVTEILTVRLLRMSGRKRPTDKHNGMKVKYFLSREELKANQTYLIPSEDDWANLLHVRWIVLSIIVHAAGHHWHEQQAQATGQALYSRESTVGWSRKDWEPQMTVAKVTASPGNEQMTKFREFSFTSQRYKAFNLQKKHEIILFSAENLESVIRIIHTKTRARMALPQEQEQAKRSSTRLV